MTWPWETYRERENERRRAEKETENARRRFSEEISRICAGNAERLLRLFNVWELPCSCAVHLKSFPHRDVVIVRLSRLAVSLTQYRKTHDGLESDPDIVVELAADRTWVRPVSFTSERTGVRVSLEAEPGARTERELADLLAAWLKTLEDQGFGNPTVAEADRRKNEVEEYVQGELDHLDALRGRWKNEPYERERGRKFHGRSL